MSIKAKLVSAVATFVLVLGLIITGVFALKNSDMGVGGKIDYTIDGANLTIETLSVEGATLNNPTNKLLKLEIDNDTSKSQVQEMFESYAGLDLSFNERVSTASINIKITNNSLSGEDNYIAVTVSADEGLSENCQIDVENEYGKKVSAIAPTQSSTLHT